MATTLTATANTTTASVLLVVDAPTGATLVALTRTDVNGSRPVRLLDGQDLDGTGALTITDYEPALTGSVGYAVTVLAGVTREDATATATLASTAILPRLAPAVRPDLGVTLSMVRAYESSRPASTTEHVVIGRRDPLVALGVQGTRRGTLGLFCPTYADVIAVEAALGTGEIVLLRQQDFPGLDMYLTAITSQVRPFDEETTVRRWECVVEYVETAAPTGALYGALGWDYAASLARNATFAESLAEFATFGDLTAGPAVV